ncbi:MAG TPA: hypothetical protein VEC76_01520 [Streptosporangiaceae bacterium]|nr:hypothetical protein [Streptosporangiaceae bacterium]
MQATVRRFDPATRSGTVFLDDGTVAGFGPAAFAGSGLRLLRPGQRVAIRCDPAGAITGLTLATFPLPAPVPGPGGEPVIRPPGASPGAHVHSG